MNITAGTSVPLVVLWFYQTFIESITSRKFVVVPSRHLVIQNRNSVSCIPQIPIGLLVLQTLPSSEQCGRFQNGWAEIVFSVGFEERIIWKDN